MNTSQDGPLLKTTRGLLYFVMASVAVLGAALSVGAVALPIYWADVLAKIAEEKPGASTAGLLPALLVLFAGLIVILGIVWTAMRKLLAIVRTVSEGDPFVRANAQRLRGFAWLMVAIQVIGIPIALLARNIAERFGDSDVGFDISVTGILGILLTFVLAKVFEQGTAMREEMEGTV